MKFRSIVYSFFLFVFLFSFAQAREIPRYVLDDEMIHGGNGGLAKAGADTINLMATHGDPTNGPGEPTYFGDFQNSEGWSDWNDWTHRDLTFPPVGDFSKIWTGLDDVDRCQYNRTPQVAFIDDGIIVPGTGGTQCLSWCYGPGGYIVNTTGGLVGDGHYLNNAVESPVMAWPAANQTGDPDYDGISLAFTIYVHEELTSESPGMLVTWAVRSADTDGSAGNGVQVISEQSWKDFGGLIFGGPSYDRFIHDVTGLMNPGRDEVQVQLAVKELGYVWGWDGNDGTPAPYFDDVTVKVFPYLGPGMSAREVDLAQDNFPERGFIDMGDLGSHHVRFDMAQNISPALHMRNDPGDSLVVHIAPVRAGAGFDGPIKLHYLLKRNDTFTEDMRSAGLPDQGYTEAMPAVGTGGQVVPDLWAFDLPDTGFLFPGDVLRYYFSATDAIGGTGGSDPQTAILPADTTGFSTDFWNPRGYNSAFTVHALPTIQDDSFGGFLVPPTLFINDFGTGGGENKWYIALTHLGFIRGEQYDIFHVNSPQSGVGNGIGGRANFLLLSSYSDILYTSGDLGEYTLANGDFQHDAGNDVGVLLDWLEEGEKDIFLTGDGLASDLSQAGSETGFFLEDKMGVAFFTSDIRPFIGNQSSPLVEVVADNPVFLPSGLLLNWIAYGGCPDLHTFDGVNVTGSAQRLAEFLDPSGMAFDYSACTLNILDPGLTQSRVISMPVDLMNVATNPDAAGYPFPARVQLLRDVTLYFGLIGEGDPSEATDLPGIPFATSLFPNPFNPTTTIHYSLPRSGHLKLRIYNVRGQLVKTLIDGHRPAGPDQTIVWDGTNNLGSSAASGIYFYEARAAGELRVGKMTLLK